jgi:hypothetical protein
MDEEPATVKDPCCLSHDASISVKGSLRVAPLGSFAHSLSNFVSYPGPN